MKKYIYILGALGISALSANAQGIVAGWDFQGVSNLVSTNVNGYAAEKNNGNNNGYATTGSISTSLAQGTEVGFRANGAAATAPQTGDGFSTTASAIIGGAETGQQSINIINPAGGVGSITFDFTSSFNVVMNFDWIVDNAALVTTDIAGVDYSFDGANYVSYTKSPSTAGDGYGLAGGLTSAWNDSSVTGLASVYGQTDSVIDLSAVSFDAGTAVQSIRINFNSLGSTTLGLDNVHITGTAVVPEPSAFAAIAGVLALGFVAARRRK